MRKPHSVQSIFVQNARPRDCIFLGIPKIHADLPRRSPADSVLGLGISDVVVVLGAWSRRNPLCCRDVPHSPDFVLQQHTSGCGQDRINRTPSQDRTLTESFQRLAAIIADRQADTEVERYGYTQIPSGVVMELPSLMSHH